MGKQLWPTFRAVILGGLAAVALIGCGGEKKVETTGSEQYQQKVKQGQPLYTPPAGAPVPGAPPAGGR